MARKGSTSAKSSNGANLGFEAKLWRPPTSCAATWTPPSTSTSSWASIFLKYISDAFEEQHAALLEATKGADPEDRDEYLAENVFWVPKEARWDAPCKAKAKQPTIGKLVDEAMVAIEKENPLAEGRAAEGLRPPDAGQAAAGRIDRPDRHHRPGRRREPLQGHPGPGLRILPRQVRQRRGQAGGEFYTPRSVVKLLVEMIEPYKGRVYDPCCGSGGMFVQSREVRRGARRARRRHLHLRPGVEPDDLAAVQDEPGHPGHRGNLGAHNADSFHNDLHKDLKADFILANPPFNVSDWGGDRLREDVRWKSARRPVGNANYAWVQHIIHHLAPTGVAGFVLANGRCPRTSRAKARSARRSSRPTSWTA